MKILLSVTLLVAALSARGQLILNAGETYSYQFSSLLPQGGNSFGTPGGGLRFTVAPGTLQAGDVLQYELFEDSNATAPFYTGTYSLINTLPGHHVGGAWQDLQGTVRFTMLSGSLQLDQFAVEATLVAPQGLPFVVDYQNVIVPVPEPSALALAGLAASVGCAWTSRKRRLNRAA